MLSYHYTMKLADQALVSVKSQHPALTQTMKALRAHYLHGGIERHSPHLLLAAARLLTEPNYREASTAISSDLGVSITSAENHIVDAINNGPDFLKRDEALLHEKGIMRAGERYTLGRSGLHPGSVYDRAWHAMATIYRPILADAVKMSMNVRGGKNAMEPRNMNYIAICLLPDDHKKYFMLNAQSVQAKETHERYLQNAVRFISEAACRYGLKFPHGFLANIEKSICARALPAIPLASKMPDYPEKARRDFALRVDAQTKPGLQNDASEISVEAVLSEGQGHKARTVRP